MRLSTLPQGSLSVRPSRKTEAWIR